MMHRHVRERNFRAPLRSSLDDPRHSWSWQVLSLVHVCTHLHLERDCYSRIRVRAVPLNRWSPCWLRLVGGSREISAGVDVVRNLCTLLFTVYRLAALLRVLLLTLLGAVHFPAGYSSPARVDVARTAVGAVGFAVGFSVRVRVSKNASLHEGSTGATPCIHHASMGRTAAHHNALCMHVILESPRRTSRGLENGRGPAKGSGTRASFIQLPTTRASTPFNREARSDQVVTDQVGRKVHVFLVQRRSAFRSSGGRPSAGASM